MTRRKGNRVELAARKQFESAGFWCYSPQNSRYGDNDLWNLFDVGALHPLESTLWLAQVKTNSTQGELRGFETRARHFAAVQGVRVAFLIRYDREGWRVIEVDEHGDRDVTDLRTDDGQNIDEPLGGYLRWLCGRHTASKWE